MDLLLVFETLVCMRMLIAIKKKKSTHNIWSSVRVYAAHTLSRHTHTHFAQIIYTEIYEFHLFKRSTAKM